LYYNPKKVVSWKFDPCHIKYEQCKNVGLLAYQRHPNTSVEMLANKDTWEEVKHVMIMKNSTSMIKMEAKVQSKDIVIPKEAINIVDSECMITGIKQAPNTIKLTTDISDKSTKNTELVDEEH
jgi:hypothetical protein